MREPNPGSARIDSLLGVWSSISGNLTPYLGFENARSDHVTPYAHFDLWREWNAGYLKMQRKVENFEDLMATNRQGLRHAPPIRLECVRKADLGKGEMHKSAQATAIAG